MGSIRVLHVGGEPGTGGVHAELGKRTGFDVVRTPSAAEALAEVREGTPSPACLVVTPSLPETSILDFLETVTEVDPSLPVVLQVADDDEDVVGQALATGATDYVRTGDRRDGHAELATRIEIAVGETGTERGEQEGEGEREGERDAETERERMRQVFNLIPDPLFAKNEDGEFVLVNEAFASSYGLTPEELEGRTEAYVEADERARQFREKDKEILEHGEPQLVYEDEFVDSDGTRRFHRTVKIPFELTGSDEPAVLGYAQDITQLKEYERELERKTEYLEEFAKVVSHDLRNPLTVARTRFELLAETCDSEHLAPIERSLDRMRAIIEETMTLAQQGQSVGEMEEAHLGTLARECWEEVDTGEATLEVTADVTIRCDRGRMRHVFENLFQNAVEHGSTSPGSQSRQDAVRDGDTEVTVRVGALEDGFYVEDDGQGIPDDVVDSLFEPGESSADDGTGFGLSIVERIAKAHGWEVAVSDSRDGGARFEFTTFDQS